MMKANAKLIVAAVVLVASSAGFLLRDYKGVGGGMTRSAEAFLQSLDEEQRASASMPYDDARRFDWHFIPKPERKGLQIKDMTPEQLEAAKSLLKASLSELGYDKTLVIMDLEKILQELEKSKTGTPLRDPERYYFTIFGQPDPQGTWGWSIEGHHLSLNFVVSEGKCASITPHFYGANPADVRSDVSVGPKKGTRVLADRETLAFELLHSMDDSQRSSTIFQKEAPADIRAAGEPHPPADAAIGLPAERMNEQQTALLNKLLRAYTETMPKEVSDERWKEINEAGFEKIHFAWAGAERPGIGHYYRIQGPTFVVEFCNNQPDAAGNPANHIHSIWRQMSGDFGLARR